MRSEAFWRHFDADARPRLGVRAETFARTFEYLDQFDRPVGVIETGCVRKAGDRSGDGGSTILFDRYAQTHAGSAVYSVDIDPEATAFCHGLVSERVRIHTGESVAFLKGLADAPPDELASLDLLFLDSFDLDLENPHPGALHHLRELTAIASMIGPETLVVVDGSPSNVNAVVETTGLRLVSPPKVGGKGKFVAEYAQAVGAEQLFAGFQCGWTRLNLRGRGAVRGSSLVRGVITGGRHGLFAVGVEDEFVGKSLRETGENAADEVARAAQFLTMDENALVVGAHVGTVAIPLTRRCRRVTAIEANPWTFKLLQCNILLNDVGNIDAHHLAASDKRETVKFVMNTCNSGGSKRLPVVQNPIYFHDNPNIVDVEADSLDARFGETPYALVFMDIEGSEYFALRGMQKILAGARTLIVEYLPHHLANVAGVTPERFVETVLPHFNRMFVSGADRAFEKSEITPVLRSMFDQGQGDPGLIFTK